MPESSLSLRNSGIAAGLVAATAIVCWPSSSALWSFWIDSDGAGVHGLLVAPLAAWLLFRNRHRLALAKVAPSPVAGVLLFMCSVAWCIFWRAGIQELHLLLLPVLMGLAVFAALGVQAAWIAAFPIGYLYFAVPAWGILAGPLQALTAHAVGVLATLIGIPAHLHGDLVVLPGIGSFVIELSCSGVNFVSIGLATAALLGELEEASLLRRTWLMCAMGVVSIISNWLRVLVIVYAGYATHMRHYLVTRSHYMFGWLLFTAMVVISVWFLSRRYRPPERATGVALPNGRQRRLLPACLATFAAVAVMPLAAYTVIAGLDAKTGTITFRPAAGSAAWRGPVSAENRPWKPEFVGPHSQWRYSYVSSRGEDVELLAIAYTKQGQGQELVNEDNALFGRNGPAPVKSSTVLLDGQSYRETEAADDQGHHYLLWSVYDIGGRRFSKPLLSQLWYGLKSLQGAPYSALLAFRTPCEASCSSARSTLGSFARSIAGESVVCVTRAPKAELASSLL